MWNCEIKYEVLKTVLQKQNCEITALYNSTTDTMQDTEGNAISESKHFSFIGNVSLYILTPIFTFLEAYEFLGSK